MIQEAVEEVIEEAVEEVIVEVVEVVETGDISEELVFVTEE